MLKKYIRPVSCQVAPGSPILVKYGNHNNHDLLLAYGFTVHNNSRDRFGFPCDIGFILVCGPQREQCQAQCYWLYCIATPTRLLNTSWLYCCATKRRHAVPSCSMCCCQCWTDCSRGNGDIYVMLNAMTNKHICLHFPMLAGVSTKPTILCTCVSCAGCHFAICWRSSTSHQAF